MPKIFVSYRRIDSEERAHAVANWLILKYGEDNVFVDVKTIRGGAEFAYVIENGLNTTDILLVIIGHKWVDELERRIKNSETDFVYQEVIYGLENIPFVIPVLLDRDIPIDKNRLPTDIHPLLNYNYMVARKLPDFDRDMEDIKIAIDSRTKKAISWQLYSGIIAVIVIIVVAYLAFTTFNNSGVNEATQTAQVILTEEASTELTANATTNTPLPTDTPTNVSTATPTVNQTETAQAEMNATATQLAVHTQAVQTAIAINNERATETAEAEINAPIVQVVAGSGGLIIRSEPDISADVVMSVVSGEIVTFLAYIVTDDQERTIWVEVTDGNAIGYVGLDNFTPTSQERVENAAEDGFIPTIIWND